MNPELQSSLNFDGPTFVSELDGERLKGQMSRVFQVVRGGEWLTLGEISVRCKPINRMGRESDASISARLRDLRKLRFGGFTVDRRRRGDPSSGLFEYRVSK